MGDNGSGKTTVINLISGALRPDGGVHRGDMVEEGVQALQLLFRERNASFDGKYYKYRDVEFFPKPKQAHLPIYFEVRDRYVDTRNPPASTAVQISKLARDGALFEIEAIAVVPAE